MTVRHSTSVGGPSGFMISKCLIETIRYRY